MTEIEVYQKILEQHNCVFDDEYSRAGDDINYLNYFHRWLNDIKVYFSFKTGIVKGIYFDVNADGKNATRVKKSIKDAIEVGLRESRINSVLE
tara:strand:+ start:3270 stop:3548 length:279 start_codon:yes stop_codon:yes gene_type:complete